MGLIGPLFYQRTRTIEPQIEIAACVPLLLEALVLAGRPYRAGARVRLPASGHERWPTATMRLGAPSVL